MSVKIPCDEMGGDCPEEVPGASLDELVESAATHATHSHGLPEDKAADPEVLSELRAAIPQSSRPKAIRSVSPKSLHG